jgi:hypothetical protein
VQRAFERVLAAAAPVDTGRSAASFRDGRTDAPAALDQDTRDRLRGVQHEVDSERLIRPGRTLDSRISGFSGAADDARGVSG